MSTKINSRSPFFINYGEPAVPLVELTCTLLNANGFAVGVQGNIIMPDVAYGSIISITSTSSDFANGKWAVVTSETSRSMTLRVLVSDGFSNTGDYIDCPVTTNQVVADCINRITLSGAIPDKTIAVFGNSTSITLSSHFSISAGTLAYKFGQNSYADLDLSLVSGVITISSKSIAGVFPVVIVAFSSSDSTTCEVVDTFNVTVNNAGAFDCTTADLRGGDISKTGVLTKPNVVGVITATKETSGGSAVTSVAANGTSNPVNKTLFYDITVPTGYSNAGATVECSKQYSQESNVTLPTLACSNIDFDDQAILLSGAVIAGTLEDHRFSPSKEITDFNFTPKSFAEVASNTDRDVTYTFTVPSGYSNTGASLSCVYVIEQPANIVAPADDCQSKNYNYYIGITSTAGSFDDYKNNFSYVVANRTSFKVFSEISNLYNLKGKTFCQYQGYSFVPTIVVSGKFTAISVTYNQNGVATNLKPEEFLIRFSSGNQVNELWRKNYTDQTVTQIF
tara:strand:- start:3840 stop:5363 length:1524 start_codon:yes stop_codon:yes gene_type:complete